jgi:hypothetical protein
MEMIGREVPVMELPVAVIAMPSSSLPWIRLPSPALPMIRFVLVVLEKLA